MSGDGAALRVLLAEPSSAELYVSDDLREGGHPYAMRVTGVTHAAVTAVDIELLYDTGCQSHWRCLLKPQGSEWHVLQLAPKPR